MRNPSPDQNATHFGFRNVDPEEKQHLVDDVFAKVAGRYDLMNDLMSGGFHRLWKDAAVSWLAPPANGGGYRHLDVAGGTGDMAQRVAVITRGAAEIHVLDINEKMLAEGRRRAGGDSTLTFVQGNAEDLPYPDQWFDSYTIAFGLRNVPDISKALAEAYRVLKIGGRFLCLEFSEVSVPLLDKAYELYSFNLIPVIGGAVTGNAAAYKYLVESIRKFPNQQALVERIGKAGFEQVKYRDLSGGIAAIHSGWRI